MHLLLSHIFKESGRSRDEIEFLSPPPLSTASVSISIVGDWRTGSPAFQRLAKLKPAVFIVFLFS